MMQLAIISISAVEYGDANIELKRYAQAEFGRRGAEWLLSQRREGDIRPKAKRMTLRAWLCARVPSCHRRALAA